MDNNDLIRQKALEDAEVIRKENPSYIEVKVLDDNSIAILLDLAFTRAICLGADKICAFTKRFCFADREQATKLFSDVEIGR